VEKVTVKDISSKYFSIGGTVETRRKPAEGGEKKVRTFLPYWAKELLRMWEEAEGKHKARRPSSPKGS